MELTLSIEQYIFKTYQQGVDFQDVLILFDNDVKWFCFIVFIPLSPREVLCKKSWEKLQKSVSIVTSISCDTFVLYKSYFSEVV